MTDINLIWLEDGYGDWLVQGSDLTSGDDLTSSILASIFTDRQALADDKIPDGTTDLRGWWADPEMGSRLWLLSRSKQTAQVLADAKTYIAEALQWMLDDGVVVKFDITTQWTRPGLLGARVVAYKQDGSAVVTDFSWAWQDIG